MLKGEKGPAVKQGTRLFATTSNGVKSASRKLGYIERMETAGTVLEGVCFYILQDISRIRTENGWIDLVTNSAKLANIIGAHQFNTILRRTPACVDIACTGEDRL